MSVLTDTCDDERIGKDGSRVVFYSLANALARIPRNPSLEKGLSCATALRVS